MIPMPLRSHLKALGCQPAVRAIFLSGSHALGTANEMSDYDLFILTSSHRIWTARFWVFVYLKLTGTLSTEQHHENRFCPNHFLSIAQLKVSQQNTYMADLIAHMQPLYDPETILPAFQRANATWMKRCGVSIQEVQNGEIEDCAPPKRTKGGDLLESLLGCIQRWKIARNPLTHLPGAEIVLSQNELRFHPRPKWRHYKKEPKDDI